MGEVIALKQYVSDEDIKHVVYSRQEIEQLFHCPTCGDIQVIAGTAWHTRPIEDHEPGFFHME